MKKITTVLFILLCSSILSANGVGIVNADNNIFLKLMSSEITVRVENQVAIVTSSQTFKNTQADSTNFKYAFPLPEGASATKLSWYIDGAWDTAVISAEPQDTTIPGGGGGGSTNYELRTYLGDLPLYFEMPDILPQDSLVTIVLEYVQLLSYDFGTVRFSYKNNYTPIQIAPIQYQKFEFLLKSQRTITDIQMLSHNSDVQVNNGNDAQISVEFENRFADKDYNVTYALNSEEFGLFGFSTYLPDSLVYDKERGTGYFTFVVEPNPKSGTEIINKVFTLVIDRSGSMSGDKMVQAKDAARFIINNLNENDKFNIVDFSSDASSFRTEHVLNTVINKNNALNYINSLNANGGTNISDALSRAIHDFANTDETTANIIIFFTDGQATAGIQNTEGILEHVKSEIDLYDTKINLFCFGIGSGANQQLLTLLASENNGMARFLANNELETEITKFYLEIQNPVLLDTQIEFSLGDIIEVFPRPLPSLYKGQQMIVSGRYKNPGDLEITLNGHALGNPVQYKYNLTLSDSSVIENHFLTKIWAKQKIADLTVQYYGENFNSTRADSLKEEILTLSIAYGIITEFTSFTDSPDLTDVEESEVATLISDEFKLLGNYPNPFNPSTKIRFSVARNFSDIVTIRIYNSLGELIRELSIDINNQGIYEVLWDGLSSSGDLVPSGLYIYTIDFGQKILSGKMILMK